MGRTHESVARGSNDPRGRVAARHNPCEPRPRFRRSADGGHPLVLAPLPVTVVSGLLASFRWDDADDGAWDGDFEPGARAAKDSSLPLAGALPPMSRLCCGAEDCRPRGLVMDVSRPRPHARRTPASPVLLLVSLAACGPRAFGLECTDESIALATPKTRADIAALAHISTIDDLFVDESELEDLHGLECLTTIGRLSVRENSRLRSLRGLDNVQEVGPETFMNGDYSALVIKGNPVLETVADLSSLEYVSGDLEISHNDGLREIAGLESLEFVQNVLYVMDNANLEEVRLDTYQGTDLERTEYAGGMYIRRNPVLRKLDMPLTLHSAALEMSNNPQLQDATLAYQRFPRAFNIAFNAALTSLPAASEPNDDVRLRIGENATLPSLRGLENATGGSIVIHANPLLTDLSGLDNLATSSQLRIVDNLQLASLAALDPARSGKLSHIEMGAELEISGNASLDECEARAFADTLAATTTEVHPVVADNRPNAACP